MSAFKKAVRSQSRLRLCMSGPSGSGKSYSSLLIANGLGGTIGAIDTERGSLSKYSGISGFDVLELEDYSAKSFNNAIELAKSYDVLIVDSFTHLWHWALDYNEKIAQAKFKGNSWSAWSETTPLVTSVYDRLLRFGGHVIVTLRSKTEWAVESGRPVRVGTAPEARKGSEFEFDMVLQLDTNHIATITKDRTGEWQDQLIDHPGEVFGGQLLSWLNDGEKKTHYLLPLQELIVAHKIDDDVQQKWLNHFGVDSIFEFTPDQADQICNKIEIKYLKGT